MDSGRITLPDPAAYMSLYTEEVSDSLLESLDEFFFPSYFQEKIEKKYELRVFYLEGEFYSMAIFSQNDSQTKVDFRKYNKVKPNRNVPFKLPLTIESKLQNLLEHYRLNTASLDIVVDKCGRYVFLEINPVGQFGMVSVPCNYYLEKKIAETLA